MISPQILVVSSQPGTLDSVNALLTGTPYQPIDWASCVNAVSRVEHGPIPDLVLLEISSTAGQANGLQTLQQLRSLHPELAIVVLSAAGNNSQVVEAIRLGAQDYLHIPFGDSELQELLLRHLGAKMSAMAAKDGNLIERIDEGIYFVAACPAMRKVRVQAELLADINMPVLILGESGTGKEITAHLIHRMSSRADRRFLKVNCAALPGELLESELFGYERGAFTGAMRTKQGKFELCDKGTILLDEVAEMSANLQAKLLHVLQDKQFFHLGGENTIEVDVRILAATNVNVHEAIAEKKFREDLYYRLSAFTIYLPPLRERQEEIPILLRHFMSQMSVQYSRPSLPLTPGLVDACLRYDWPGNLRELENFVKRYLVMGDEGMAIAELRQQGRRNGSSPVATVSTGQVEKPEMATVAMGSQSAPAKSILRSLKDETEVHAITRALQETHWNRKRAARLLNISYRGLLYKIRQHGITRASTPIVPSNLQNGHMLS